MSVVRVAAAAVSAVLSVTLVSTPTHASVAGAPRVVSSDAEARHAAALTITRATPGVIVTGSKVTFTGTAPAELNGKRVALLRRVGAKGQWVKVASAAVADGAMKATGVATGVGKNSWEFSASVDGKKYTSPVLSHAVYGWFYLFDQNSVDDDGGERDSWQIGGKTYSKSVGGSGSSATDWIDYNLSYRCIKLDAYYGIGDDSETGTTADFYVTLDGDRTLVGSKGLGPATHLVLDTSTRLRVRLEMDPTNADEPDGSWAFGNAKVLCKGKP